VKIVLLLGCLEPKKNGIADYSHALSKQLNMLGHSIYLIAWKDEYIPAGTYVKKDLMLRMSPTLGAKEKQDLLKVTLQKINPDWVSIQFVAYSFHKKGLPFNLGSTWSFLSTYKVHIMFHELWVEPTKSSTLASRSFSKLQEYLIKNFIKQIEPSLITTSILKYQEMLKPINTNLLPLFGNIEIAWKRNEIIKDKSQIKVIIFGNLTSDKAGFEQQIIWLNNLSSQLNKQIEILFIGSNGNLKDAYIGLIQSIINNVVIQDIGELDVEVISLQMLGADIGISRASQENFGKSGSTIAMLEHGLPVLLRGSKNENTLLEFPDYKDQLLFGSNRIEALPEPKLGQNRQIECVNKLIELLEASSVTIQ